MAELNIFIAFLSLITATSSIVIAFHALIIAKDQAEQARKHDTLSVKPILHKETAVTINGSYNIFIKNFGIGSAIITNYKVHYNEKSYNYTQAAKFRHLIGSAYESAAIDDSSRKSDKIKSQILEVLDGPEKFNIRTQFVDGDGSGLAAGDKLLAISFTHSLPVTFVSEVPILLEIDYEDIYGNKFRLFE